MWNHENKKKLHYPAFDDIICLVAIKAEDRDIIELPGYLVYKIGGGGNCKIQFRWNLSRG